MTHQILDAYDVSDMTNKSTPSKHIVIAGGGFAGVRAALKLADSGHKITLVASQPNFIYYPQLYHVATGGSRTSAAIALSGLFAGKSVMVVEDKAVRLDKAAKTLTLGSGDELKYDKLMLAVGSITTYFGIKGIEENSFDIKSIAGAEAFKSHLHTYMDKHKRPDANYVIIGAGPTGVELAASLVGYLKRITKLHGVHKYKYEVVVVEAAPRILPRSPESVAKRVHAHLEGLGIKVLVGQAVEGANAEHLQISGKEVATQTVVWTAGIANNPFYKENADQFTLNKRGHVEVDEHLQADPDVYVVGDNAAIQFSGMAQSALSHAAYVAKDILRTYDAGSRPAYKPTEAISAIPVGESWAVTQRGKLAMYGLPASILRRLADLVGYHDIQSLGAALKTWAAEYRVEDGCDSCQRSNDVATPVVER